MADFDIGEYEYTIIDNVNNYVKATAIDKTKSSYGELSSTVIFNGITFTVTSMEQTFFECVNLIQAPSIPSSVVNMSYTFDGCTSLTIAPEIPSSVTSMSNTFRECNNLIQTPEIPNSVITMNDTFYGCTSLIRATEIPSSVVYMDHTFDGCTSLITAPEIPSSVTNMNGTFKGCTSLKYAPEIPNSVTSMNDTFYGCSNISNTIVINSIPNSSNDIFNNTEKNIYIISNHPSRELSEYWKNVSNEYSNIYFVSPIIDFEYDSDLNSNGITFGEYNTTGCGKIISTLDTIFENGLFVESVELESLANDLNLL